MACPDGEDSGNGHIHARTVFCEQTVDSTKLDVAESGDAAGISDARAICH